MEFHDKLFAFIKSKVSDHFIAEDLLHDVFVKILSKLDTLEERGKMESWIYQITRNTVTDYYRTNTNESKLANFTITPKINEAEETRLELSSCLLHMINQLPDKYRIAIQLSEIEGEKQKEIARLENITLSGAKSRVQRGRVLLKKILLSNCQLDLNSKNQITDSSPKKQNCYIF